VNPGLVMSVAYLMFDDSFNVHDVIGAAVYAGMFSLAVCTIWRLTLLGKKHSALPYGLRVLFAVGAGLLITAIVAMIDLPTEPFH
jgi:hypothetical protein